jgi:hypothetical protein
MGDLILADFRSKTYHKPDLITLERLAAEILEQVESSGIPSVRFDRIDLVKDPA